VDRSTPLLKVTEDASPDNYSGIFMLPRNNKSVRSPVEMSDMAAKLLITDVSPRNLTPPGSPTESDTIVRFTPFRVMYHCEKTSKRVDNDENSNTESAEECG
jgi:hypothetical protein